MSLCAASELDAVQTGILRAVPAPGRLVEESSVPSGLTGLRAVDAHLARWTTRVDQVAHLAAAMGDDTARLSDEMADGLTSARRVLDARDGFAPGLVAVQCWASMVPELDDALYALLEKLDELTSACEQTRSRLGQARRSARLLLAGRIEDAASGDSVVIDGRAVDAARAEVDGVAAALATVHELVELVGELSTEVESMFELPMALLHDWQLRAEQGSDELQARVAPRLAAELSLAVDDARALARRARRCRTVHLEGDLQPVTRSLLAIA